MIISTINIFYLLTILFIWVEIFGFTNRGKVTTKLNIQEIENSKVGLYLLFFFSKLIYLVWIPLGFFGDFWIYHLILFCLGVFRFIILQTRKNIIINLYDFLNPFISCIILLIILIQALFQ